jgi:hypothetical protein
MNKKELKYPLVELKKVIHKWLYMEGDEVIDIIVAVYIANKIQADPLWMIVIAPPSNTKTELLRAFDGHNSAYFISNLTPSTLVSGIPKKKNKPEPSLLPKLNDKLVILKDFTTILSMRSENQQEILAQLREAYDGQYTKVFGNGKEINWKGRFGLLAACTPVYDSHHGVIGSMGERFLLFRTGSVNGEKMGLQAQRIVGKEDEMRAEIRQALHRFIDQFDDLSTVSFEKDGDVNMMIIALASLVAHGRCPVQRDYRAGDCVSYQPMPEGTPRLVKQFMQIGMGLALAYGKNKIDTDIYKTVKKIGCDLIPAQRLMILKRLWQAKAFEFLDGWETTTDVGDSLNIPGMTVKRNLEDLMMAGALNRKRGDSEGGRPPYRWQISQQLSEWIGQAEAFD